MTQLTKNDLCFILNRIPKDVLGVVKEHNLVIAGGFIRSTVSGEQVSDIDILGSNPTVLELASLKLCESRKGRQHKTKNAITVLCPPRIPVQFITRWTFEKPEDVVLSFDFTVCQAAIWFKGDMWESCISDCFYSDLAAKRLVYTMPQRNEDAGGSLLRVLKFIKRGYNIQAPAFASVIARLTSRLDLDKGLSIKDEAGFSIILTGLIREVDPLTVVDGVDIVDEHEVEKEDSGNN